MPFVSAFARRLITLACISSLGSLLSCASRKPAAPELPHTDFAEAGYVDLQPGWRIRAVTPVTKSGNLNVVSSTTANAGGGTSLKASADFLGYEVAYYSVEPRDGGGVSVHFHSASVTESGKTMPEPRPMVQLFQLPKGMNFVRLLFLTRVSPADHDQGIVAAPSLQQLQVLTEHVQADPEHNCAPDPQAFCAWVPNGIAVQPEKRSRGQWVPAT